MHRSASREHLIQKTQPGIDRLYKIRDLFSKNTYKYQEWIGKVLLDQDETKHWPSLPVLSSFAVLLEQESQPKEGPDH